MSTVVITGANRGLGLELTRAFAGHGHTVIAGCRNPAAASALDALGVDVMAIDTGDAESIEAFAAAIGDRAVDVLINNAGIDARNLGAADSERDVLAQTADQFLGQMQVNALGPLLLARALLPNLRAAANARIVNVSSQVGSLEVGKTIGRDVGYAASKAALNMITLKLANRLRDEGMIAVCLHPGFLKTDMGGAAATMEPAEAAASIVALIERLSPDDSGSFLRWDGTIHPW